MSLSWTKMDIRSTSEGILDPDPVRRLLKRRKPDFNMARFEQKHFADRGWKSTIRKPEEAIRERMVCVEVYRDREESGSAAVVVV